MQHKRENTYQRRHWVQTKTLSIYPFVNLLVLDREELHSRIGFPDFSPLVRGANKSPSLVTADIVICTCGYIYSKLQWHRLALSGL